jgi:putative heme iron utilization protein
VTETRDFAPSRSPATRRLHPTLLKPSQVGDNSSGYGSSHVSPGKVASTAGDQPVASLAVLERGAPAVSLVPFVVQWDPLRFAIVISDLSGHTQALREDPRVGLLIHEPPTAGDPRSNHALPRVMVSGTAQFLSREEAQAQGFEALYRAKYEIAEIILGLADFHFCQITPTGGSFIQGFGQAFRLSGPNLDQLEHLGRADPGSRLEAAG